MTKLFVLFLILTTGICLNYSKVAQHISNPVDKNKTYEIQRFANVSESIQQFPYNLFKTKKDFVKLSKHYVKNRKPYKYKKYKPYSPGKTVFSLNQKYVVNIIESLNLLKHPHLITTTESISSYIQESQPVTNTTTFLNNQFPTTQVPKNKNTEATEPPVTETAKNLEAATPKSSGESVVTELAYSINSTTLNPFIETTTFAEENRNSQSTLNESKDTTKAPIIIQELVTEDCAIIYEKSTQNYEKNKELSTEKDLEIVTTTSWSEASTQSYEKSTALAIEAVYKKDIESSVEMETIDTYYRYSTEEIRSAANFNNFDLVNSAAPETNLNTLDCKTVKYNSTYPLVLEADSYKGWHQNSSSEESNGTQSGANTTVATISFAEEATTVIAVEAVQSALNLGFTELNQDIKSERFEGITNKSVNVISNRIMGETTESIEPFEYLNVGEMTTEFSSKGIETTPKSESDLEDKTTQIITNYPEIATKLPFKEISREYATTTTTDIIQEETTTTTSQITADITFQNTKELVKSNTQETNTVYETNTNFHFSESTTEYYSTSGNPLKQKAKDIFDVFTIDETNSKTPIPYTYTTTPISDLGNLSH